MTEMVQNHIESMRLFHLCVARQKKLADAVHQRELLEQERYQRASAQ